MIRLVSKTSLPSEWSLALTSPPHGSRWVMQTPRCKRKFPRKGPQGVWGPGELGGYSVLVHTMALRFCFVHRFVCLFLFYTGHSYRMPIPREPQSKESGHLCGVISTPVRGLCGPHCRAVVFLLSPNSLDCNPLSTHACSTLPSSFFQYRNSLNLEGCTSLKGRRKSKIKGIKLYPLQRHFNSPLKSLGFSWQMCAIQPCPRVFYDRERKINSLFVKSHTN